METHLTLLTPASPGADTSFDLDQLSGRRNAAEKERVVITLGAALATINVPGPGVVSKHLSFEWSPKSATWTASNIGPTGSVLINGRTLDAKPLPLNVETCIVLVGELRFLFQRTPAPPRFRGKEVHSVVIPADGLVIGRGSPDDDKDAGSNRFCLDSEVFTISSNQARIFRENGELVVENLHSSAKFKTKLNGNQNFEKQALVFGDCLQIPDYDNYTFQFDGRSLVHIGGEGIIQARGLEKVVGDGKKILAGVDLDLRCGDFVGVLGGSGQGKSTLMNAVCAISPATKGDVWLDGRRLSKASDIADEAIGYVPQDDIVHRELAVREALIFGARLRLKLNERQISKAVDSVLQALGLEPHQHKPVKVLSGGQRKRVSIASELLTNPRFIFLDEPTSGLDPQTEDDLMGELMGLANSKRMGVFCTTHILKKSNNFDSIIFVQGGRLIFKGSAIDAVRYFLLDRPFDENSTAHSRSSSGGGSTSSGDSSSGSQSGIGLDATVTEEVLAAQLPIIFREINSAANRLASQPGGVGMKSPEVVALEMETTFKESRFSQSLIPVKPGRTTPDQKNGARRSRPGFLKTLSVLISRQWRILKSDRLNLLFLLAQALLIGAMVGWVSDNLVFQMFIGVIATLWFGCSNGAQQIVGELPIFRRERLAGVGLNAYLVSKFYFLTLVTTLQAFLMFFTILTTHHLSHPEVLPLYENHDSKLSRQAFVDEFFSNQREFTMPADVPAAAAIPAEDSGEIVAAIDFVVVAQPGMQVAPPRPTTHYDNPSGLRAYEWQFGVMERLGWFFRIRENIIGELGVRKVEVPHGSTFEPSPKNPWWAFVSMLLGLRIGGLLLAAVVGVALGLTVSALVRTPTQAVMWVPLILIPQILFGSFVVTSPEMNFSVRQFASLLPSFNVQRIQDVTNLYGRKAPLITNKTKIPAFFASPPYDEETTRWTNRFGNWTEKYDKISEVNKSWQNLTVITGVTGKRSKDGESESVKVRRDVIFPKGVGFHLSSGATTSLAVLGIWIVACYLVILIGLRTKESQS